MNWHELEEKEIFDVAFIGEQSLLLIKAMGWEKEYDEFKKNKLKIINGLKGE